MRRCDVKAVGQMSETEYSDFEFERTFLVRELPTELLVEPRPTVIVQSYFLAEDGYALRIRLQGQPGASAWSELQQREQLSEPDVLALMAPEFSGCILTAKGPGNLGTRYEAERVLDVTVGQQMVARGGNLVAKYRYSLWYENDGWSIDQFLGSNAPLLMAECERDAPVIDLAIPEFCLTEVSDDPRFTNDALSRRPFGHWAREFAHELSRGGTQFNSEFGPNAHEGELN